MRIGFEPVAALVGEFFQQGAVGMRTEWKWSTIIEHEKQEVGGYHPGRNPG
jgi:hypothetical protein